MPSFLAASTGRKSCPAPFQCGFDHISFLIDERRRERMGCVDARRSQVSSVERVSSSHKYDGVDGPTIEADMKQEEPQACFTGDVPGALEIQPSPDLRRFLTDAPISPANRAMNDGGDRQMTHTSTHTSENTARLCR